jgi:hypothetical protein
LFRPISTASTGRRRPLCDRPRKSLRALGWQPRKLSGGNQVPAQRLPYPVRHASLRFLCSESNGALTLAGHRAQIASLAPVQPHSKPVPVASSVVGTRRLTVSICKTGDGWSLLNSGAKYLVQWNPGTSAGQERRLRRALGQPVLHSMVRESRVLQLRICTAVPQPRTSSASSVIVSRGTGRGRGRWRRRCRVLRGL